MFPDPAQFPCYIFLPPPFRSLIYNKNRVHLCHGWHLRLKQSTVRIADVNVAELFQGPSIFHAGSLSHSTLLNTLQ